MERRVVLVVAMLLIQALSVGCVALSARAAGGTPESNEREGSDSPRGAISSTGETWTYPEADGDDEGAPGWVPGSPPAADAPPPIVPMDPPARPTPPADPARWPVYRNERYGFSVRYPPSYLIAAEADRPEVQPPALFLVDFQDRHLASSPTADLQPPQFAVIVHDNPVGRSLEDWLRAHNRLSDEMMLVEPVTIGGIQGLRTTGALLIAPNTFAYVARRQHVYAFTLLGEFSEHMLQTVVFFE